MRLRQKPKPEILGDVRILVFVHKDVAEPALVLLKDVVMRLEDGDHVQEQVAEIAGVEGFQALLVGGVKLHAAVVERPRLARRNLFRGPGAVLPLVDHGRQRAGGPAFFVDILGDDDLLHQPDLVVRVQNGEVRLEPHQFGVPPEQLHADRVEGAKPGHALCRLSKQRPHAGLHLSRGLVGEGHGKNLVRAGLARRQKMRDAGRQRPGLARSRACKHQHRTIERFHRLALRRVQPVEIGRRPRRHGALRQRGRREGRFIVENIHAREPRPSNARVKVLFTVRSQVFCCADLRRRGGGALFARPQGAVSSPAWGPTPKPRGYFRKEEGKKGTGQARGGRIVWAP